MNREASIQKCHNIKDIIDNFLNERIVISQLSPYQISQTIEITILNRKDYISLPLMYKNNIKNYINHRIEEIKR